MKYFTRYLFSYYESLVLPIRFISKYITHFFNNWVLSHFFFLPFPTKFCFNAVTELSFYAWHKVRVIISFLVFNSILLHGFLVIVIAYTYITLNSSRLANN